jgi:predicted ATPase/DNA-binding CsgD family transcriptional regulator
MKARVSNIGEKLIEPLTNREREILVLLAQGYSALEIAQLLTLAVSTVKWYVQQAYGKLGVHNKQQAILRAGELRLLETRSPIAYGHSSPKHNLPSQLTSFIEREKDVERIQQRLAGHRLVTLIGVGGIGKTRLSQQVANQLIDNYANGVWLVEFAALNDPTLVPQSVATVFGIQQMADPSGLVETLIHFFQSKTLLLILDNCEHLLDACAGLADQLLRNCPNLKILATSREALGILGEALYQVPSLTIPDIQPILFIEKLNEYESTRLFTERAQLVQIDFALTKENASSITQICSHLDGIPLAIELAAVRIQTLPAEQIAQQLDRCFHILTGGSRTALPKHQTLQASIDWSHNLLSEPERVLFRRLAVFAGGWTLETAKAVCVGDGIEADDVLNLITQLVNKSLILIKQMQGQEARYHILETIRQYASERLLEAGEAEQLRNRHLDFFLQWLERVEPEVRGAQQLQRLDQIEAEHDNLRAALEWSLTQVEHGEASLRLAGALPVFWNQRGYVNEGLAWLEKVLSSQTAPRAGGVRAKALYGAGFLACWQGDRMATARTRLEESAGLWRMLGLAGRTGLAHALATSCEAMRILGDPAAARSLADEAIALCREQDERWGLAYGLTNLGIAIRDQEDFALARSVLNESVALWRELGDLWGLDLATHRLGEVAVRQGNYEVARRHFMDCLVIAKKRGDQKQVAWKLSNLALIALNLGDWAEAKVYNEQCFSMFQELGSKYGQATAYSYFGFLTLIDGDNQQAQRFFEQALEIACKSGPIWLGANTLMGLACAAASTQAWRAARLLGAAEARLKAGASYWDTVEKLCVGRATATAMAQLGETAFAAAQAEGWAMTFEQAADYALETEPSA